MKSYTRPNQHCSPTCAAHSTPASKEACPTCLGRGEVLSGVGSGEEDCPDCEMTDKERDLFLKGR